jgi:hypothetical protein
MGPHLSPNAAMTFDPVLRFSSGMQSFDDISTLQNVNVQTQININAGNFECWGRTARYGAISLRSGGQFIPQAGKSSSNRTS